LFSSTVFFK